MNASRGIVWLFPELAGLGEPGLEALLDGAAGDPDGQVPILRLGASGDVEGDVGRAVAECATRGGTQPADAPIPVFVGVQPAGGEIQTRLHPAWRGVLPGDRWPASTRRAYLDLLRALHPSRLPLFLALENLALGGFELPGPDDGWATPPDFSVRGFEGGPLVIAICGIDGSGKSTHLAALREWLAARGARIAVHKIYRHGVFHETVTDVARLCSGGRNLHLWRLERLAKVFDSVKVFFSRVEPDLSAHDVLLFDRYVFTHFAAIDGRSHHDPFVREMLGVYPRPHLVVLLDLPVADALDRIGRREARTIDENEHMLGRDRSMLLGLAPRLGFRVLDARAPFDENQAAIREEAGRLLVALRESGPWRTH